MLQTVDWAKLRETATDVEAGASAKRIPPGGHPIHNALAAHASPSIVGDVARGVGGREWHLPASVVPDHPNCFDGPPLFGSRLGPFGTAPTLPFRTLASPFQGAREFPTRLPKFRTNCALDGATYIPFNGWPRIGELFLGYRPCRVKLGQQLFVLGVVQPFRFARVRGGNSRA